MLISISNVHNSKAVRLFTKSAFVIVNKTYYHTVDAFVLFKLHYYYTVCVGERLKVTSSQLIRWRGLMFNPGAGNSTHAFVLK